MQYWLMKSEPHVFSLDDLRKSPRSTAPWEGVRNYQARNFMRTMRKGDIALFYHSSCDIPGVAGLMQISGEARSDETQFDKKSEYFDPGAKRDNPRWSLVDVRYLAELPKFVPLATLRQEKSLANMRLLAKRCRLSVMPVTPAEYRTILSLGEYASQRH